MARRNSNRIPTQRDLNRALRDLKGIREGDIPTGDEWDKFDHFEDFEPKRSQNKHFDDDYWH